MARMIDIPIITDSRGSLCVIENKLPFEIKRIFYIYNVSAQRGGHAHHKTQIALLALGGSCVIDIYYPSHICSHTLSSPSQCLLLEPSEWHIMREFSPNTTLLALASRPYDPGDYIVECPYQPT